MALNRFFDYALLIWQKLSCRSRKQKQRNSTNHRAAWNKLSDWFILLLLLRLRQSGFHQIVSDGIINGVRRKWKRLILPQFPWVIPTPIPALHPRDFPKTVKIALLLACNVIPEQRSSNNEDMSQTKRNCLPDQIRYLVHLLQYSEMHDHGNQFSAPKNEAFAIYTSLIMHLVSPPPPSLQILHNLLISCGYYSCLQRN